MVGQEAVGVRADRSQRAVIDPQSADAFFRQQHIGYQNGDALFDRNPQTYVDNIFLADEEDFVAHTHRVYHSPTDPSYVEVKVLRR